MSDDLILIRIRPDGYRKHVFSGIKRSDREPAEIKKCVQLSFAPPYVIMTQIIHTGTNLLLSIQFNSYFPGN
jgi:hypothetical protein